MNQIIVKMTNELNDDQKKQVAVMYYKAFVLKFTSLWLFSSKEEEATKVLVKSIAYENGIYAIDEKNQVLGFTGLEIGNKYYTALTYAPFREAYSVFASGWRHVAYAIYRIFHSSNKENSLHIDPIVVSENARGMGIGSKLFDAVFEKAKKLGLSRVVLEVVDTNPKAHALYKRLGFRAYKAQNLGLLTYRAGFKKIYCMEKILG